MSNTNKKEGRTLLHRASREYSTNHKTNAVGRIKQGHGSFICPCCVHMNCNMRKVKPLSRRLIRRTQTKRIDIDE